MTYLQQHVSSARRSPEVTVIDAVPVETTYSVVEPAPLAPALRGRGGVVQFFLEFGWALTNGLLGVAKSLVGLGMPLGLFGVAAFVGLYFLTRHDYALTLAAVSAGVAFVAFTFCYLSGVVEAMGDRFVAKGRRGAQDAA